MSNEQSGRVRGRRKPRTPSGKINSYKRPTSGTAVQDRHTTRTSWDDYFLAMAELVSSRSTCPRAQVGAVIVNADNRVLVTGYNGAPSGYPHCTDVGCLMVEGHCKRAVHGEISAIAQAASYGISIKGATLYLYDSLYRGSCESCALAVQACGMRTIMKQRG